MPTDVEKAAADKEAADKAEKEALLKEESRQQSICTSANRAIKQIRLAASKARYKHLEFTAAVAEHERAIARSKQINAAGQQKRDGDFYANQARGEF